MSLLWFKKGEILSDNLIGWILVAIFIIVGGFILRNIVVSAAR